MSTATEPVTAEWWHCTRKEYDADTEYERSTKLKDYWEDPPIYESRWETGEMPKKKKTRQMVIGDSVHALALEDNTPWKIAENCGAKKKNGELCNNPSSSKDHAPYFCPARGIWVCGTHKGKDYVEVVDALTPKEDATVRRVARAINEAEIDDPDNPQQKIPLRTLLDSRFHERACRSIDPATGIKKKALVDMIVKDRGLLMDLKTTETYDEESIWRLIHRFGYGFSMAHYESVINDVVAAKTGQTKGYRARWTLIFAETVPPYRVTDYPIPSDYQDYCRREHRTVLEELAESKRTGIYKQRERSKAMPMWLHTVIDSERGRDR